MHSAQRAGVFLVHLFLYHEGRRHFDNHYAWEELEEGTLIWLN